MQSTSFVENRISKFQRQSISLEGHPEGFGIDGPVDIGIANEWTFSFWFFVNEAWTNGSFGKSGTVLDTRTGSPNFGANSMEVSFAASTNRWRVELFNSSSVRVKDYTVPGRDDLPPHNGSAWYFMTITWDGTDLKIYRDGVELVTRKDTDDAVTMTQTDRGITILNEWYSGGVSSFESLDGRFHWLAIWDTALTQPEIEATFNDGSGNFDLQKNQGGYLSSDSLVHWWRMGLDPDDIGADQVGTITLEGAGGFSKANLVNEIPQKFNNTAPEDTGYTRSLLLASGEHVRSTSVFGGGIFIGASNNFTVSVWCKPTDFTAGSRCPFAVTGDNFVDNDGAIYLTLEGGSPADAKISLYDSSGVLRKEYDYSDFTGSGNTEVWVNWIFSWNGTSLVAYRNGSVQTPTTTTDDALTRTSAGWRYGFGDNSDGEQWIGNIGHIAIWEDILTAAEAAAIAGGDFQTDLNLDFGDYASATDLATYWKFGWFANDGSSQPANLQIGKSFASAAVSGAITAGDYDEGTGTVDSTNSVVDAP